MRRVLALSAVAVLTACGGGSGGGGTSPPAQIDTPTPAQRVAALEASGAIPSLDRSAGLAGTDANANGVRDDVDAHITAAYAQELQRAAATQFARTVQQAMTTDLMDPTVVKAVAARSSRAVNCVYSRFAGEEGGAPAPAAVVQDLRAISTNTRERMEAYLAYARALSGTSATLPEGDTCD